MSDLGKKTLSVSGDEVMAAISTNPKWKKAFEESKPAGPGTTPVPILFLQAQLKDDKVTVANAMAAINAVPAWKHSFEESKPQGPGTTPVPALFLKAHVDNVVVEFDQMIKKGNSTFVPTPTQSSVGQLASPRQPEGVTKPEGKAGAQHR